MATGQTEDLATLSKLDDKVLLDELKARYNNDKIYTYVGDILVAFNPYRDLGIYTNELRAKYVNQMRSTLPPHIYAVSDAAYQAMRGQLGTKPRNQCVLISGESGAGKTESTKLIVRQLVQLSGGQTQLEQQIVQVNPLLEAFGNAQTLMNDNSSRFGRYIQLKFYNGQLVGSKISEYLLEKSRVVLQNEGEENFHVFYYMFAGLTADKLKRFGLGDPKSYKYFSDVDDSFHRPQREEYDELVNAMDWVGFTDEQQDNIFSILASVLNLGNIDVQANDINEAVVSATSEPLRVAARVLGFGHQQLLDVITCSVTYTRGEPIRRNYTREQSIDCRDAVAKALYGRVFSWIIHTVNSLLAPEDYGVDLQEIGILDIFGFEHFEHNSFEQACINLANEQLQFFFNKHVFLLEQEEYRREGIDWNEIKFVDNQPLLDLFLGKPIGIMALLDEESIVPRGSDKSFVEKLTMKFDHDPHFIKSTHAKSSKFTIAHYAGHVTYSATGWLEKNRDTMPPGVMHILQLAENPLIKLIFGGKLSRTGTLVMGGSRKKRSTKRIAQRAAMETKERKLTVGAQFKNSLSVLMERMVQAQPIFVRCIKPNTKKAARLFDDKHVNAQLLYTGMLQTTRIRREGFAVRPTFAEFVEKYRLLAHCRLTEGTKANCQVILATSKLSGWQMGRSKVFLKYYHIEELAELMALLGRKAVHMQRLVRGFLARRHVAVVRAVAEREKAEMQKLLDDIANMSATTTSNQNQLKDADARIPASFFEKKRNVGDSVRSNAYLQPVPTRQAPPTTIGTGTDDLDSNSNSDEDTFVKTTRGPLFGPAGTKKASNRWFTETQTNMVTTSAGFADWFHGIISRAQSEKLLNKQAIGCYLIRVSESRFGYTLSFRAEDRCRHYMIEQLPNSKFTVMGESKVHRSLHDMVDYYQRIRLSNWPHLLTKPCGQQDGQCDYADLFSDNEGVYFQITGGTIPSYGMSRSSEQPTPPQLPDRLYSMAKDPTNGADGTRYGTHIASGGTKKRISTTRARPNFR